MEKIRSNSSGGNKIPYITSQASRKLYKQKIVDNNQNMENRENTDNNSNEIEEEKSPQNNDKI